MSPDAGATLVALVGVLLLRLTLQGTYKQYVKDALGPWLTVAGVVLVVLGVVLVVVRRFHGDGHDHGGHDHAHDHGAGGDPDGHDHDRAGTAGATAGASGHGGEWAGWLLLAPVLVLVLVAPPALGASSLDRVGNVSVARGAGDFAALPAGPGPHDLTLLEFAQRGAELDGAGPTLTGKLVRLTGFVATGEGFTVARYRIACCAADALAVRVAVTGYDGETPPGDTWVEVEGWYEPGPVDESPRLKVSSVEVVPPPEDPYES